MLSPSVVDPNISHLEGLPYWLEGVMVVLFTWCFLYTAIEVTWWMAGGFRRPFWFRRRRH